MRLCKLTSATLLSLVTTSAAGATIQLHAIADSGSRYISHSFDGLFELGRTRPSTRVDEPDGAFLYSELPDYVPLGGGAAAFPNKSSFSNLGLIEYDDATGEITDLQANFAAHVAPGVFTYYQAVSVAPAYTTSFDSFSGAVAHAEAGVPTINLTSPVVFSIDGSADASNYALWKENYGSSFTGADGIVAQSAPDPAGSLLAVFSCGAWATGRGRIIRRTPAADSRRP